MRGSAIAASLAVTLVALSAAPVFAQAAGQQPKPAAPAAQTPKPATPPPAAPAQLAPPPQPPAPFPQGAKIAYINPAVVFQTSTDGKAGLARVQALIQKKQKEGEDKAKQLQGNQQKLQSSGGAMNDAARAQLEKDIERQQKEGERFQQDAQAEVNELQQEVQNEFCVQHRRRGPRLGGARPRPDQRSRQAPRLGRQARGPCGAEAVSGDRNC